MLRSLDTTAHGTTIVFPGTVDPHVHLRDDMKHGDGRMEIAVLECEWTHAVVYGIGNVAGLTTSQALRHYKRRAGRHRITGELDIRVARLLTDSTILADVRAGWNEDPELRAFDALKTFLPGVSNDMGMCLVDWRRKLPVYRFAAKNRIPCFFHLEQKYDTSGKRVRIFDREWQAVTDFLKPLIAEVPNLEIHVLHVSDHRTVQFIIEEYQKGRRIYGGICPQYLLRTFDDLFEGAHFHSMELCWPIYKFDTDQESLRSAMLSGLPCFRFETDMAMHSHDTTKDKGVKITCRGDVCGGVAILPSVAMSLVIEIFAAEGKLHHLGGFVSGNAREQLHLPETTEKVVYKRIDWTVPPTIERSTKNGRIVIVPFLAGSTRQWKRVA